MELNKILYTFEEVVYRFVFEMKAYYFGKLSEKTVR